MKDSQVERRVAQEIINRSDHDKRRLFFKVASHENWLNPRLYYLIMNIDKLSIDTAERTK